MSDYLARAAERAGPVGLAIRPRLQSRYEGSPAPVGVIEEERETESAAVAPLVAAPRREIDFSANKDTPMPFVDEMLRIEARHEAIPQKQDSPLLAPVVQSVPLLQERVVVRNESLETRTIGSLSEVSKAENAPGPLAGSIPLAAVSEHREKEPTRSDTTVPQVSPLPPQPLLELPRSPLPAAIPTQETTTVPPAVNITIGRLEIRAAPVAAKPKMQPPPAGRGPLALDEFLRGKSPRASSRS